MKMQKIKLNDKEYDFDTLSDAVKQQIQSLQFVDSELSRLASQIAVLKTARRAYERALNQALQTPPVDPMAAQLQGDTLKLG